MPALGTHTGTCPSRQRLDSMDPVLHGSYMVRQELLGSMDPILQRSCMAWQTPWNGAQVARDGHRGYGGSER